MKKSFNQLGAVLCAGALLATVGCDSIRDYSVNSYQGVLPSGDVRQSGSVAPSRQETAAAASAVPAPAPTSTPPAGAATGAPAK